MIPDLSPAVARAQEAAQTWSRQRGATEVRPEHLLHALLDEEEGGAARLLAAAGLSARAARDHLAVQPVDGPPHAAEVPQPLAPAARRALRAARAVALDRFGDPTVTSEALLVALLGEGEPLRDVLASLGLDPQRLDAPPAELAGPPLQLDEPLCLTEPVERVDTDRILDAAANRAREALRVLEDYTRFVLNDPLLSSELKAIRHDLAAALVALPVGELLAARDTLGDVGTELRVEREGRRQSFADVVRANACRLQEALRSLEEFGKLRGADFGQAVEALRYRSYTLEKALVLGSAGRHRLEGVRLYALLTGSQCLASLDWTIAEAAAGGVGMFQLREKHLPDRELLERAQRVRQWTRRAGALFIVNDRPDIARLAEADGVHLGQDDLSVRDARHLVGPDAIVGVSTHDLDQLRRATLDGASYVGVGPTFPSGTKDFAELAGLEYVRAAAEATSLPAFALGGIHLATIDAVIAAGATRVAVSQAIARADDPRTVARELRRRLDLAARGG